MYSSLDIVRVGMYRHCYRGVGQKTVISHLQRLGECVIWYFMISVVFIDFVIIVVVVFTVSSICYYNDSFIFLTK